MRRAELPRVHLLAHANPLAKDLPRLGCATVDEYVARVRGALGDRVRLTCSRRVLASVEDPQRGGRSDDAARIRDLQGALDDPGARAIVAASGGGWFLRLMPQLRFDALRRRTKPLWVFGFSEMTSLVNRVAAAAQGRGVYWLCPNYLAWKLQPPAAALAAFDDFFRRTAALVCDGAGFGDLPGNGVIRARLVAGAARNGPVRLVGGCLSVLAAMATGALGRGIAIRDRWLALEDVNEEPYRLDRYLATLKLAGWLERVGGVLVGDFRGKERTDETAALVALLEYHLPRRNIPVAVTHEFGHVWPMTPLVLNRPLLLRAARGTVEIDAGGPLREGK